MHEKTKYIRDEENINCNLAFSKTKNPKLNTLHILLVLSKGYFKSKQVFMFFVSKLAPPFQFHYQ